ncbi:MAG: hypothetical protein DSY87_08935 [Methylococcus sp.]|nr:MAG: hypothetical protein DSY87_08935 [Methylococcus sp.]
MHVIKLGGSLANTAYLVDWLEVLSSMGNEGLVIVPGGGRFAEEVRRSQQKWKFDDRAAHRMALLAMHQYGLMNESLGTNLQAVVGAKAIPAVLARKRVAVWLPDIAELDKAAIACNWTVTSDALSAWLAGHLRAGQLTIVKSCPQSGILARPENLVRKGILDPALVDIWKPTGIPLKIFHCTESRDFAAEFDHRLAV